MRIGFYLNRSYQEALFETAIAAIRNEENCLVSRDVKEVVRFRPHVLVAADDLSSLHLRVKLPRTIFVQARQGLTRANAVERSLRAADYVCLSSEYVRDDYERRDVRPRREYWVTGYTPFDRLAGLARPAALIPGRRVVLYVPSRHEGISSAPLMGDGALQFLGLQREDTQIVVKLHPELTTAGRTVGAAWLEKLRSASRRSPHFHLIEDPSADILPWLANADVLVSDASSAQLEFLAFNRPMVLINHRDRFGSPWFDPCGYEWLWRDMGTTVNYVEDLPAAIDRALRFPDERSAQREKYRERLFGSTLDGRAGERLAARLLTLETSIASESVLLAANSAGRVLSSCLVSYDGLSQAWRRATA